MVHRSLSVNQQWLHRQGKVYKEGNLLLEFIPSKQVVHPCSCGDGLPCRMC